MSFAFTLLNVCVHSLAWPDPSRSRKTGKSKRGGERKKGLVNRMLFCKGIEYFMHYVMMHVTCARKITASTASENCEVYYTNIRTHPSPA